MDMNFASNGKANAALTTGIIGTAGFGLNWLANGLGGLFGGNACGDNAPVNRYELGLQKEITNKDMEIAFLRGRDAAKTDDLALYQYVDGRLRGIEAQISQQAVVISCMQSAIATLQGLTKTVIPISSVCPEPMPAYNSWTAPTASATTTG